MVPRYGAGRACRADVQHLVNAADTSSALRYARLHGGWHLVVGTTSAILLPEVSARMQVEVALCWYGNTVRLHQILPDITGTSVLQQRKSST